MTAFIIGVIFGILFICLGRWVYRNSKKILPGIIFNSESPLLQGLVRLFGGFFIFSGLLAILIGAASPAIESWRFAGIYELAAIIIAVVATRKLLPDVPPLAIPKKRTLLVVCAALGAVCVFTLSIVVLVFGILRNSDVCSMALQHARTNQETIQRVGEPIKPGLLVAGSIQVNGSSGHADLQIPISGPKGKAEIYAVANKKAGRWNFETLEVAWEGDSKRIDLLKDPATPFETLTH